MKRILPAFLLLALAACDRKGILLPVMDGHRPVSWRDMQQEDDRRFRFICSLCGSVCAPGAQVCPLNSCMAPLTPETDYRCPNCTGDGACVACRLFGQENQVCYWCGGSGWTADGVACVHCHEARVCAVCQGHAGQCDICGGDGRVTMADLQARAGGGMPAPQPTPQPTPEPTPEPAPQG